MRFNPIPFTTVMLMLSLFTSAQDSSRYTLQLKSGAFIPAKNISTDEVNSLRNKLQTIFGKTQLVIQFEELPNQLQQQELKDAGIELVEYISGNAYTAILKESSNTDILHSLKSKGCFTIKSFTKIRTATGIGQLSCMGS